jgi:hypothetical protein
VFPWALAALNALASHAVFPWALAALNALPGPGARSGVQSLAVVCETHGLGREVQVLQAWLSRH